MASDRRLFNLALEKWEELKDDNYLSIPSEIGKLAIFCALPEGSNKISEGKYSYSKEARIYRNEAMRIAEMTEQRGTSTTIIFKPTISDFAEVLTDPAYSDIVTVGDGSLSEFYLHDEPGKIAWNDIADLADHLKTGVFEQRQCGVFSRELNVPLGTFCVEDVDNVLAAAGSYIYPRGLDHPHTRLIYPALRDVELEYDAIKEAFRKPQVG
jgi:hypothetical protein